MLVYHHSLTTRRSTTLIRQQSAALPRALTPYLRQSPLCLPEMAELDVVRHYTRCSQRNFGIEVGFYPLGSCTMKYNPRAVHALAQLPGLAHLHPCTPDAHAQGILKMLHDCGDYLKCMTGMAAVSLTPMAGAQGEWVGMAMIKAYHAERGDHRRTEVLIPDAAHGTNPASAVMCGFTVKTVPTGDNGDWDVTALEAALSDKTAAIMLTNPSTLGVFERQILQIADKVHAAGGLLYYDGANLNAILGRARPGDMGFDVMHLNCHKTFATPHGGGGPGAGPVLCHKKLAPYLPAPHLHFDGERYSWVENDDGSRPFRVTGMRGNVGVMLRAYWYMRLLGREGLGSVGYYATLNANYLMHRLQAVGYTVALPQRRASHEFIISLKKEKKQYGVSALDVVKRLLDFSVHAPTVYFPQIVPECLLIEPTETESRQTLDRFVAIMASILDEIKTKPDLVKQAPHAQVVKRVDELKAARDLDVVYYHPAEQR